jgi:hypothetical protein
MTSRLDVLADRKRLLVTRLQLQRMELSLRAANLRDALRPANVIGGTFAQPAALVAIVETIAPLFGMRRLARWTRLGAVAMVLVRILRNWRGKQRTTPEPPVELGPDL